jgi:hypothetical protein
MQVLAAGALALFSLILMLKRTSPQISLAESSAELMTNADANEEFERAANSTREQRNEKRMNNASGQTATSNNEAKYLLSKIITTVSEDVPIQHPWLWERDRWKELAFALVARVTQTPAETVRKAIDHLNDLGLLDITELANIPANEQAATNRHAIHILELLTEMGFSSEDTERTLFVLSEAASGFQESFGGKVQKYLRTHGELMLRDVGKHFQFTSLSDEDVRFVFTFWLQSVADMPVALLDESVDALTKKYGLSPSDLVDAADELDLNVALLDDFVRMYLDHVGNVERSKEAVAS